MKVRSAPHFCDTEILASAYFIREDLTSAVLPRPIYTAVSLWIALPGIKRWILQGQTGLVRRARSGLA